MPDWCLILKSHSYLRGGTFLFSLCIHILQIRKLRHGEVTPPQSYQVSLEWQLERQLNQGWDWGYEGSDRVEILSPLKLHQPAVFLAAGRGWTRCWGDPKFLPFHPSIPTPLQFPHLGCRSRGACH